MRDRDQGRALYIISVAAELAGVHAQTLRIYERKGLIEPQRTQGGSRRYSDHDIELLRRIQELTNEGVSLVGVRKILELEDELARQHAALEQARRELSDAIESTRREYRRELVPVPRGLAGPRRSATG
jgi:MerR family transcriptional regulator/heat shock protein HspR